MAGADRSGSQRPAAVDDRALEVVATYLREAFPEADFTEFWNAPGAFQEYRILDGDHHRYHLRIALAFFEQHAGELDERMRHWGIGPWLRAHPDDCVVLGLDGPRPCE